MKIKIKVKERDHSDLLTKFSLVLFGIFLTTLFFAILIQLLQQYGIYLGIILSAVAIYFGFKYSEKKSDLRLVIWSVLVTLISCIGLYLYILSFVINNFKDL